MAMAKIIVIFPDDAPLDRISEVLATIAGKVAGWNVEIIFESEIAPPVDNNSPVDVSKSWRANSPLDRPA